MPTLGNIGLPMGGGLMHAVTLEVDADESVVEAAREYLNTKVAPQVRGVDAPGGSAA
jgi:hypothetical protein